MLQTLLYWLKRILPTSLVERVRPPYHLVLAYLASQWYRHPSKEITVIAVTGTKGKSTVTEMVTTILEADGNSVASLSTIQFKIGKETKRNLFKMTMPGRFFVQRFLRNAVNAGCTYAVIEMTSEGAKQFRHRFIEMDALVFTNLSPEHIESHGSFEKYKAAKLAIAQQLADSAKQPRYLVVNTDDEHGADFLRYKVEEKLPYSLEMLKLYTLHKDGVSLVVQNGQEEVTLRVPLVGLFNVYNALAAITLTRALGVTLRTIDTAFRNLPTVKGRVEHFYSSPKAGKHITVVVDYAHTPDSLEKLYLAFKDQRKIGVLGNTGGGRDTWKRPEMAALAEAHCESVILTNEDPYDENPRAIVEAMLRGITDQEKATIIMDRRLAIRTAIEQAEDGMYIIVSGKGTDPYIMGPHNTKQPWSDADVVQKELLELERHHNDTDFN